MWAADSKHSGSTSSCVPPTKVGREPEDQAGIRYRNCSDRAILTVSCNCGCGVGCNATSRRPEQPISGATCAGSKPKHFLHSGKAEGARTQRKPLRSELSVVTCPTEGHAAHVHPASILEKSRQRKGNLKC